MHNQYLLAAVSLFYIFYYLFLLLVIFLRPFLCAFFFFFFIFYYFPFFFISSGFICSSKISIVFTKLNTRLLPFLCLQYADKSNLPIFLIIYSFSVPFIIYFHTYSPAFHIPKRFVIVTADIKQCLPTDSVPVKIIQKLVDMNQYFPVMCQISKEFIKYEI